VEFTVGARNELLTQARALQAQVAARAKALAIRSSTNLSRLLMLGLLGLAFLPPRGFVSKQVSLSVRTPNIEIVRTRPTVAANPSPQTHPVPDPAKPQNGGVLKDDPVQVNKDNIVLPSPSEPSPEPAAPATPVTPPSPPPPSAQPAPAWTDSEIAVAKTQCGQLLEKKTIVAVDLPPTREGVCGAPAARELKSLGESKVEIEPPAMLDCPMIAGLDTWTSEKLQPAAMKKLGSKVVRILTEGSYSCRNRYGLANAPISEHAFMNAIDFSGFVLANGKVITIAKSWTPPAHDLQGSLTAKPENPGTLKILTVAHSKPGASPAAASPNTKAKPSEPSALEKEKAEEEVTSAFLHQVHDDACGIFGTVLGPDANAAHRDHFHLDMKARRYRSICE
jgi:hypothetical protein